GVAIEMADHPAAAGQGDGHHSVVRGRIARSAAALIVERRRVDADLLTGRYPHDDLRLHARDRGAERNRRHALAVDLVHAARHQRVIGDEEMARTTTSGVGSAILVHHEPEAVEELLVAVRSVLPAGVVLALPSPAKIRVADKDHAS